MPNGNTVVAVRRSRRPALVKKAYNTLKERLKEKGIDLELASEDEKATMLLLIGGCSNCCPSYKEFKLKKGVIKMWDESHIDKVIDKVFEEKKSEEGC